MTHRNYGVLEMAMERERSVQFTYHKLLRKCSPYVLGYTKGQLYCLMYQYDGKSKSGRPDGRSKKFWRCFKLIQIQDLKVLDDLLYAPAIISHKKPQWCVQNPIKVLSDYDRPVYG